MTNNKSAPATRERPIIFSGAMVRALLAGTKTQTRRIVKSQPPAGTLQVSTWRHPDPRPHFFAWWGGRPDLGQGAEIAPGWCQPCPYGAPGDRLWVRETHWYFKDRHDPVTGYFPPQLTTVDVEYSADGESKRCGWFSPIHMPRWASRITLEITGVRVERVQDISEADAQAEGVVTWAITDPPPAAWDGSLLCVDMYRDLWESINGAGSWGANPYVWVLEFRRVVNESLKAA